MASGRDETRVAIGRFGAAHGVRGEIRLKSYTEDPLSVTRYGPLVAQDGRSFTISKARPAAGTSPDMLVVSVEGVTSRNDAETLNGIELSVPRARLPEADDGEFYHADLIGLAAETVAGEALGTVIGVRNFGAGDILEIAPSRGETLLVPFTKAVVPEVDVAGRRVTVDPPPGLLDKAEPEDGEDREDGQ